MVEADAQGQPQLTRQRPVELQTQSRALRAMKCSFEIRRHFQAGEGVILWKKESIKLSLIWESEMELVNFENSAFHRNQSQGL